MIDTPINLIKRKKYCEAVEAAQEKGELTMQPAWLSQKTFSQLT